MKVQIKTPRAGRTQPKTLLFGVLSHYIPGGRAQSLQHKAKANPHKTCVGHTCMHGIVNGILG